MATPGSTSSLPPLLLLLLVLVSSLAGVLSADISDNYVMVPSAPVSVVYRLGAARGTVLGPFCQAFGSTWVDLRWKKVSTGAIINSVPRSSTALLAFSWSTAGTLAASDAGDYVCELNEGAGFLITLFARPVSVTIAGPPLVSSLPATSTVMNLSPLQFTCSATGYQVDIQWLMPSGLAITLATTRTANSAQSVITFPAAKWNNGAGTYSCAAFSNANCTQVGQFTRTETCYAQTSRRNTTVVVTVDPPEAVDSLSVSSVTSSSASVQWSVPRELRVGGVGQAPLNTYTVLWSATDSWYASSLPAQTAVMSSAAGVSGPQITQVLSSLPSYANIRVAVFATDESLRSGAPANATFRTLESAPAGRVNILQSSTSATSISIMLGPPVRSERNGNLTHYGLTFVAQCAGCPTCCSHGNCVQNGTRSLAISAATPDAPVTFAQSGACSSIPYDILVSACNTAGCGPTQAVILATRNGVPKPPENVRAMTINSSAILLSWQEPAVTTFGPYFLFSISAQGTSSQFQDSNCHVSLPTTTIAANTTVAPGRLNTFTAVNLCPNTVYNLAIIGINQGGSSSSVTVSANTTDGMPSPPVFNLTAVSSSALLLQWSLPVAGRAGVLTRFSIHYVATCPLLCCCIGACNTELTITIQDSPSPASSSSSLNQRTAYSQLLSSLCPSTVYTVDVTTSNRLQDSTVSPTQSLATNPGFPGAVRNATCTIGDVNPSLLANLTWSPPSVMNGPIVSYTVALAVTEVASLTRSVIQRTVYGSSATVATLPGFLASPVGVLRPGDVIYHEDNVTLATQPGERRTPYQIADGNIYFYNVTAATAAGPGPSTMVMCVRAWTTPAPTDTDAPDSLPIVLGIVIPLIIIILLAAAIALYLRRKSDKTTHDGADSSDGTGDGVDSTDGIGDSDKLVE